MSLRSADLSRPEKDKAGRIAQVRRSARHELIDHGLPIRDAWQDLMRVPQATDSELGVDGLWRTEDWRYE